MSGDAAGHVLVVDDDASIREVVALVLADAGYRAYTAGDGREALALLGEVAPDLILLDMKMPGMDGWQFAEHYRKLGGRKAPLVVMTAAWDAGTRAGEVAAADYLAKPFDLADLLALVGRHAHRRASATQEPSPEGR